MDQIIPAKEFSTFLFYGVDKLDHRICGVALESVISKKIDSFLSSYIVFVLDEEWTLCRNSFFRFDLILFCSIEA